MAGCRLVRCRSCKVPSSQGQLSLNLHQFLFKTLPRLTKRLQLRVFFRFQQDFLVLETWPSRLPDLNPVENLWFPLANRVLKTTTPPRSGLEMKAEVNNILATTECTSLMRALAASCEKEVRAVR